MQHSTGKPSRRAAIVTALAAALGSRAARAQGRPIRVGTSPNDSGAEAFYAVDMGFFAKAGLDVSVTAISNGGLLHAALMSGTMDIASVAVPAAAQVHERGFPIVLIAPGALYESRSPTSGLVVAKSSPIKVARDLGGKTIGVRDLQNPGSVATKAWIDQNGGDSKSVLFVELPDSASESALTIGRIAAASIAEPFLSHALGDGLRMLAATYDAIARQFMIGAFATTRDYAAANPEIIRTFQAVIADTARWANANHARSGEILAKWAKVDVPPTMARVTYADRLLASDVQPFIDVAAKYGFLKASFPASEMFAPGVGSG